MSKAIVSFLNFTNSRKNKNGRKKKVTLSSHCYVIRYTPLGKFHHFIGHEGPYGEYRYSSTLFLTSALEGGEGSASCSAATYTQGKTRYPLYSRLGGSLNRSGQVRKISPPLGFDPRTVQPVGS